MRNSSNSTAHEADAAKSVRSRAVFDEKQHLSEKQGCQPSRDRMRKRLGEITIILSCVFVSNTAAGSTMPVDCTPYTDSGPTDSTPYTAGCQSSESWQLTSLYKTEQRVIRWPDGFTSTVTASSQGNCVLVHGASSVTCSGGHPPWFQTPAYGNSHSSLMVPLPDGL